MAGHDFADRLVLGFGGNRAVALFATVEKTVPWLSPTLRQVKRSLTRLSMGPSQEKLAKLKRDQLASFLLLRDGFKDRYQRLKGHDISRFTIPLWENYNAELERAFLPTPEFPFLQNPVIKRTMFMTYGGKWLKEELAYLEGREPKDRLKKLLQEDYVGQPILSSSDYLTSHNSIHHLYHAIRFSAETGANVERMETVIEWGGGYGNLAKIFTRMRSRPLTYIIVDTPLFSCIQWLYLATIFGRDRVRLIDSPNDRIHEGVFNLLPICFIDNYQIRGDLFTSTWALSESSKFSQDYVVDRNWFNSRHLLLAYHGESLPCAGSLGWEDIDFLPGHRYTFR